MFDKMAIALFVLVLIALGTVTVAIGWLSILSKRLASLGKRVLKSQDIERAIQAADKTASFESRMSSCESRVDNSKNLLVEHDTKLTELVAKQEADDQMIKRQAVNLAMTSEKMESFELRFNEFENNLSEKLNNILELGTKVNELSTKLESTEVMVNNNGSGLAEANQLIKDLRDKIESLEKFRTIVEKTHSIIQAAFIDMRSGTSPEEGLEEVSSEIAKPEGDSRWSQDEQEEVTDQATSEAEAYHYP